jgi:hypothetical protein
MGTCLFNLINHMGMESSSSQRTFHHGKDFNRGACVQQGPEQQADRPIYPGGALVVWRYTVRHSADLSELRALKKYR